MSLNYVTKLKPAAENPVYSCIFQSGNVNVFEESPSKIPPPIIQILSQVEKSKINLALIDVNFLDITPCTLLALTVRFNQTNLFSFLFF